MSRRVLLFLFVLVLLPVAASGQDTRVIIQQNGTTQGGTRILNCAGGMACTVDANGVGIVSSTGGGAGGLADPGANGIVKRILPDTTAVAVPGTDYVIPSGSITGNAATATTIQGKTTVGTGTEIRMSSGSFSANDYVKIDASGNLVSGGDVATQAELTAFIPATATALAENGANCAAGLAPLGVNALGAAEGCFDVATQAELTAFVPTTAAALAANGLNCDVGSAPVGVDAAGGAEGCFDVTTEAELTTAITGLQPLDPDLTTLAGKTIAGTGTNVRLSNGAFAPADCVQVDASGNFVSAGAACGTGSGSGVTDGDKTDIVVSGGATVWTIDTNSVTNAKLSDMTGSTIKCRTGVSTGDPEDCNAFQIATLLDSTMATQSELSSLVPATASALAANGGNCGDGLFPRGVDTMGAVEDCTDAATQVELNTVTTGLAATGTINQAGNPVHWSQLKGVPSGFADGSDDGTGGGGVSDGDKTDIVVSSSGAVWTIDTGAVTTTKLADNAVTNAKVADMANSTLKCRTTAGSGDPEDCSATQVRTILNVADGANALTSNPLSQFAATSSAQLASVLTDENGTSGGFVRADSPTLTTPNLGTPSTLVLTNATGLPLSAVTGLGANVGAFLTTPSSANLASALTDEMGSGGGFVRATAPTLNSVTLAGTNIADDTASVDFSAASVTTLFAAAAGATPTADNDCRWDTTAHRLKCGENGTTRTLAWTTEAPKVNSSTVAPTTGDDETLGYSVFSRWIDTTPDPPVVYVALDVTTGAAVWAVDTDTDTDSQSLADVATHGRDIFDANSLSTAVKFGIDNGDGDCSDAGESCRAFYSDPVEGSVEKVIPNGNNITDIDNTFAKIWRYNGTEAMRLDSATLKFSNTWKPRISFPWDAGGVTTDGTNCAVPTEEQVNSGPWLWNFGCADGGAFHGRFRLRSAIDPAATLTLTMAVRTIGTTGVAFAGDVSMQCRGVGDVLDNTWTASPVACDIATTGPTANAVRECTATGITPNGGCAAGDWIFWRYVIDNATHTATAATAKVIGGLISVVHSQLGE